MADQDDLKKRVPPSLQDGEDPTPHPYSAALTLPVLNLSGEVHCIPIKTARRDITVAEACERLGIMLDAPAELVFLARTLVAPPFNDRAQPPTDPVLGPTVSLAEFLLPATLTEEELTSRSQLSFGIKSFVADMLPHKRWVKDCSPLELSAAQLGCSEEDFKNLKDWLGTPAPFDPNWLKNHFESCFVEDFQVARWTLRTMQYELFERVSMEGAPPPAAVRELVTRMWSNSALWRSQGEDMLEAVGSGWKIFSLSKTGRNRKSKPKTYILCL